MRAQERGFLLLSSYLGDPARKPLTTAQMRTLADRSWQLDRTDPERDLELSDLTALGYAPAFAQHILDLLDQEDVLDHYLTRARHHGCIPIARVSDRYPLRLRKALGLDSPGVLWAKGDLSLLQKPVISLVGSRELQEENRQFAREVGRQAALQGYCLVSGNARGADRSAQDACLEAGGNVISVVADELTHCQERDQVLYLSEEDFDAPFCAQRAISRNRVIHALGLKAFVAQCSHGTGGTWDGTVKNLRFSWSPVYCFGDGSPASIQLMQMGATLICLADLENISALPTENATLFDQ